MAELVRYFIFVCWAMITFIFAGGAGYLVAGNHYWLGSACAFVGLANLAGLAYFSEDVK